jgi:FKBP-type peptidyl-prolyl cis-trans isomerase FklB
MGAIKKEFNVDMNQVSYSFGQNIRQKIKQQGITDLIEPEFISSFAKAKNNSDVNLDEVNSKLNEIRQAQGRYPDSRRALSKYIGMYYGATEGAGDFLNNMMVVVFAKGFTDKGKEINALGVNCDSLFTSEKNKYNEFLGKRYLEENKKRTEVKTTASGLQYEVLEKGDGDLPNENSDVTVHYKGTLVSGDVFDSSLDRGQPISFNLQGVIPGWTEGLQLMPKGAKYRFYIPYELGYGGRAAGKIPPYSTLVFEVQLIEF